MTDAERKIERSRMLNSTNWPRWPILPLKNYKMVPRGSFPAFGFIVDAGPLRPDNRFNIYEADIFNAKAMADAITEAPKYSYVDVDAALDAGWTVD